MHRPQSLGHTRLLVIVDNLDIVGVASDPPEAHPPLIVDPDAVLPRSIPTQLLQPIPGRHPEVLEAGRGIQLPQFAQRHPLQVRRQLADRLAVEQPLGIPIAEAADHVGMITRRVTMGKVAAGVGLTNRASAAGVRARQAHNTDLIPKSAGQASRQPAEPAAAGAG